ncbi:MAG: SIS domain-containing protein [Christensenellaceae bacterium]|jgi:6-phospho-3-hexuloisomerase
MAMDRVKLRANIAQGDADLLNSIEQSELDALTDAILEANRIFVAGFGRAGNSVKILSMNCSQAGLETFVVGDNSTPSIHEGDLLVIGSGSGETKTMAIIAQQCKEHGAKLALISGNKESTIGKLADINVLIPRGERKSKLPEDRSGSFYHVMLMAVDCVQAYVMEARGLTGDDIRYNHNNLE